MSQGSSKSPDLILFPFEERWSANLVSSPTCAHLFGSNDQVHFGSLQYHLLTLRSFHLGRSYKDHAYQVPPHSAACLCARGHCVDRVHQRTRSLVYTALSRRADESAFNPMAERIPAQASPWSDLEQQLRTSRLPRWPTRVHCSRSQR